jgi:HEAT repeat protein
MRTTYPKIVLSLVLTASALGQPSVSVADLIKASRNEGWNNRVLAVQALARAGRKSEAALTAIIERLGDPDVRVRINAALAFTLNDLPGERAVPALIGLLQDKDWRVREDAAAALGAIGPQAQDAVPALIKELRDPIRDVFSAAGNALIKIAPNSEMVISALAATLRSPDLAAAQSAAEVLEALGVRARPALPALTQALHSPDSFVQVTAAAALRNLAPAAEGALSALIAGANDPLASVRRWSVWALGTLPPETAKRALPTLKKALQDSDAGVRLAARGALAKVSPGMDISRGRSVSATGAPAPLSSREPEWTLLRPQEWKQAEASARNITAGDGIALAQKGTGEWTSTWHDFGRTVDAAEIRISAEISLFDHKTIAKVVEGKNMPYTDRDQIPHDWYGRCMIAILDAHRWVMAIRSGVDHIDQHGRDTLHLLTSNDEGRTWSGLDRWFDGSPVVGLPYEDGYAHSEPGLYRMPNGDLILQFWRTWDLTGTKQLRSRDGGKTWATDLDRIAVKGVQGARGDMAIGTEDYFIDPEHPSDVYMAFEYFQYQGGPGPSKAGTLLALSQDNGRSYTFLSWMGPLGAAVPGGEATFEPSVEYVGHRTIVAVLRDANRNDGRGEPRTMQVVSTDMGRTFGPMVNISHQINGGFSDGIWGRPRLYKESDPVFQYAPALSFAQGEGRLWGTGFIALGGGPTRTPVVYWSDDNARTWLGPEPLHGDFFPGSDNGYGDLKRRVDGTFVAVTYFANHVSTVGDVEQYTFGGKSARVRIETEPPGGGVDVAGWHELYDGENRFNLSHLPARRWRVRLRLSSDEGGRSPRIRGVEVQPH